MICDMVLIHNIRFAGESEANGWILINDEFIEAVGHGTLPAAQETIDGKGALALPGVIDCHVHFREPGLTAKADISSESRAAIAGGVTSFLDMPNTNPPTTTIEAWNDKMHRAEASSLANYGFFIGATNANIDLLKKADYHRVPGVKLFMGSSTGNMLVDDNDAISRIFREVPAIVAVHAEDQCIISNATKKAKEVYGNNVPVEMHSVIRPSKACYASSAKAVALAKKYNHRLHICHITTAEELSLLTPGDAANKLVTSEVSPHHLMWCDKDYATKGTRIKMNPAVKSAADRQALIEALESGLIDMVATDHAPHRTADKEGNALTAASGAPLVQFSLPWMLSHFSELTVQRVMCANPATIYHIDRRGALRPGYYADIALVKPTAPYIVKDEDVISKCGWTPMEGVELHHRVAATWVNGRPAYAEGCFTELAKAMPLAFAGN